MGNEETAETSELEMAERTQLAMHGAPSWPLVESRQKEVYSRSLGEGSLSSGVVLQAQNCSDASCCPPNRLSQSGLTDERNPLTRKMGKRH